jgi:hypothetical protein
VIGDAKVQAPGKWLCLERPICSRLFEGARFPIVEVNRGPRRTSSGIRSLPAFGRALAIVRRSPEGEFSNRDLITNCGES